MKARVKQTIPANTVRAFQFLEFVKYEWREVPPGFEQDALNHPMLEIFHAPDRRPTRSRKKVKLD